MLFRSPLAIRMHKVCIFFCVAGLCFGHAHAQPDSPSSAERAAVLIEGLRVSIASGLIEDSRDRLRTLEQMGEPGVTALRHVVQEGDAPLRARLVRALVGWGGATSTSMLLEIALADTNRTVRGPALSALANRPVTFPLTEAEVRGLQELVTDGPVAHAGPAAGVLARCELVPLESRSKPVIDRLESEAAQNTKQTGRYHGSSVSKRVFDLNQFLIAFDSMRDASVTKALHERPNRHQEGSPSRKWLLMALGMAGDPSVADPLRSLVLAEKDLSTKAVALRAFARSAREDAVSLLLTFENDDTPGGRDSFGPLYPLQMVARGELARLREPN